MKLEDIGRIKSRAIDWMRETVIPRITTIMPIWGNVKTLFELNKSRVGMDNSFEILSKEDVKYLSIPRNSKGKYSKSSTYIPVVSKVIYSKSKR